MRQSTSLPPSNNSIPIQTTTTLPVLKQNTVDPFFAPIQQQCNSLTTTFLHEQHPQNSFVSDVDKPISSVHLRRQTDFIGSLSDQQIALEEYCRQRLGETSSRQVPNAYYRPPDSYYQNHLASSPEVGSNDRTRNAVAAADAANSAKIIVEEKRPKRAGQSATGKKKRNQRTMFSEQQLTALEQSFRSKAYLTLDDRAILSKELGIPEKTIKIWYQNRRSKHKKLTESADDAIKGTEVKTAKNSLKEGIKATSQQQIHQHNNIGFSQRLRSSATDLPPFQSNRAALLPTYSSSANYQHSTALQAHNQQQQQSVPYDYDGFSTVQPPSMRFQQRNFTQPWAFPSHPSFSYPITSSASFNERSSSWPLPFQTYINGGRHLSVATIPQQSFNRGGNYGHF